MEKLTLDRNTYNLIERLIGSINNLADEVERLNENMEEDDD